MNIRDLKKGSYKPVSTKLNVKNLPKGSYKSVQKQQTLNVNNLPQGSYKPVSTGGFGNTIKNVGKDIIGTPLAVMADLGNVIQPWKKEKDRVKSIKFLGNEYQTPSSRGLKSGQLARKGEYKKAAGELGMAGLDIASTFYAPAKGVKAFKGAGALKGALQGAFTGSQIGAGYGLAGGASQGQGGLDLLKSTGKGALGGAAAGGVLGGGLGIAGKSLSKYSAGRKLNKASQGMDAEAKAFVSKPEPSISEAIAPKGKKAKIKEGEIGSEFKERGFVKTVRGGKNTDARLKMLIEDNYIPQPNDDLVAHSINLIQDDINKAKAKAMKGDDNLAVATASELIKHYQNTGDFDQAAEITKTVAQKLTEHGRAIQAASLYNKLSPEGIKMFAQKELGKEGLTLTKDQSWTLENLAYDAQKAKTPEAQALANAQMLKGVGEMIPSKLGDQITTLWKAGLLTNPTTHIANLTGNTAMGGMEMMKDVPATVFDRVAAMFTGKRTKTTPNILSYLRGMGKGSRKAWVFMKTGVDIDNTLSKYDFKQVNLPPVAKQYAETIFRALGAGDKVFKGGLMQKSLRELAVVDGINSGLKGKALKAHVDKIYNKPTTEMVKIATEDALYGTFNNQNALSDMLNVAKGHPNQSVRAFTEFVAPFGRTPANIANTIIDYSPAGFIKAGSRGFSGQGQRSVVDALGRATVGTGIGAAGYGLGKAGMMTGNYPTNSTERNLWELQGKQANSIRLGDNSYSLNRLSPAGNILSTGAAMSDLGRMKPENIPFAAAGAVGKNLLGQTYLQGVSGMLNAFQDPKRYGGSFSNRLAGSMIPSISGAGARALDPVVRQKNTMGEAIQSRIPGMSQNLLPRQDVFGEDMQYSDVGLGTGLNPFFNPVNPREAKDSPLNTELDRLFQNYSGLALGDPSKTASISGTGIKIDMTPEEYRGMLQQTGGVIKGALEKVVAAPAYETMSDYDRSKAINNIIGKVREVWNLKNVGTLDNTQEQLKEQLQKQIELRSPNPFYSN